jgi:hypothetical protein
VYGLHAGRCFKEQVCLKVARVGDLLCHASVKLSCVFH